MKYILLLLTSLFVISPLNAQIYSTGFDSPAEQNGWQEYELGQTSTINNWSFESLNPISSPNTLAHYYPVGGTNVTDDWFVSPAFDFTHGGTIDSIWYKFSGFGVPATADTIGIYLLTGSPDPALASSIQLLKTYSGTDYMNDDVWRYNVNIAVPSISGQSYLAFRYKTIINWLDTKFDNLVVTANFPATIQTESIDLNIQVFPNPSKGYFKISTTQDFVISQIMLYDINGREVELMVEDGVYQLSDKRGMKILKIITDKGIAYRSILVQ